jgi:hypothetical protein
LRLADNGCVYGDLLQMDGAGVQEVPVDTPLPVENDYMLLQSRVCSLPLSEVRMAEDVDDKWTAYKQSVAGTMREVQPPSTQKLHTHIHTHTHTHTHVCICTWIDGLIFMQTRTSSTLTCRMPKTCTIKFSFSCNDIRTLTKTNTSTQAQNKQTNTHTHTHIL